MAQWCFLDSATDYFEHTDIVTLSFLGVEIRIVGAQENLAA